MKITKMLVGLGLACGFAANAGAVSIDGNIAFGPDVGTEWAFDGACTTVADCNGFTLTNGGSVEVTTASGDFALLPGTIGTMANVNVNNLPVLTQWTVGGFSFDLLTAQIQGVIRLPTADFLVISGSGTAYGNNFDPTPGTWTFSADSTGGAFSFSSTTAVAAVPEPGSLALLSLGLLALGGLARRRARG